MKLLAIDTATEACSAALWLDGEIVERYEFAGREHSWRLPRMVPALLADAGLAMGQLDGLVAGIGPGSFAGVRIGVSYLKGLALGLDRPAVGVSSLAMLAQAALDAAPEAIAVPAIDARMGELYLGRYRLQGGVAQALMADAVLPPEQVPALAHPAGGWLAIGTGWGAYPQALATVSATAPLRLEPAALPRAGAALVTAAARFQAGEGEPAAALVPAYLRNKVALTAAEQAENRALR